RRSTTRSSRTTSRRSHAGQEWMPAAARPTNYALGSGATSPNGPPSSTRPAFKRGNDRQALDRVADKNAVQFLRVPAGFPSRDVPGIRTRPANGMGNRPVVAFVHVTAVLRVVERSADVPVARLDRGEFRAGPRRHFLVHGWPQAGGKGLPPARGRGKSRGA